MVSRNRTLVKMFRKQRGKCSLCGKQMALIRGQPHTATIEHIIPRSKGGNNCAYNLRAACESCNKAKGSDYDGPLDYWAMRDGWGRDATNHKSERRRQARSAVAP